MSLIRADARHLPIAAGSVQCVVTSPPYWGLRDYGTATWEGGSDPECDHRIWGHAADKPTPGGRGGSMPKQEVVQRDQCRKCGAKRVDRQLGLEPTPDAYVANMVAVFRQVHRVLRDDGVMFLNLGDSYNSSPSNQQSSAVGSDKSRAGAFHAIGRQKREIPGLKPKDLVGIPWRVAFALQADGWYLRSDIIWSKPNPMPESVTDRPTKAHEYVFLLTKAERYYWDAEAVREANTPDMQRRASFGHTRGANGKVDASRQDALTLRGEHCKTITADGRNIRSVWSIATQPYSGAHFATMPEALAERCILAGSRPGDLVLDPFVGSGTVARCAISLGRRAVGCDLNPSYLRLADERTQVTRGLPLEMGA